MPHHRRAPHHLISRWVALACAAVASAPAIAQEESPYYIGVSQGFTRDSNVLRRSSDEIGDTISSTGVLAGINQSLGRQRLFADANAQVNRYRNFSSLNNKSYSLLAGLDWETIGDLSGGLHYTTRDSLAYLSAADGSIIASNQRTQQFSASARYGLASRMTWNLGYDHNKLALGSLSGRDSSQDTVSTGLRWAVGGKLTVGAGVRVTKGRQETVPVADETDRRDVDLTATWASGGASTFNARVSSTRETHSLDSSADLSETTGAINWSYRPTGKLSINASVSRDTGTETTFTSATGEDAVLQVDNNRLSTSWLVDTRYELTGKSHLGFGVRQRRGTSGNSQSESLKGYTLGMSYAPTRNITLNCNVAREDRSASGATDYTATITGCTGQLTLR